MAHLYRVVCGGLVTVGGEERLDAALWRRRNTDVSEFVGSLEATVSGVVTVRVSNLPFT